MHSSVDTIQGIATLVKQSSLKGQNIPQLICDSNGHRLVQKVHQAVISVLHGSC